MPNEIYVQYYPDPDGTLILAIDYSPGRNDPDQCIGVYRLDRALCLNTDARVTDELIDQGEIDRNGT